MTRATPEADDAQPVGSSSYPPRYHLEPADHQPLLLRGVYSIVVYLGVGYLLLQRWDLLLVLFGIILLHEGGHFWAMKYFNYSDVSVLFLPFVGALVKGRKKEISQQQSVVILLAGPVPGMLLGILVYFLNRDTNAYIGGVPLQLVSQLLIWANLLNLLPLYPLDGGQLLNRVFLDEQGRASNIFKCISFALMAGFAILSKFYFLLIVPAVLLYRFLSTQRLTKLELAIEQSGIDTNQHYEELNDEQYWQIRALVIQHTPAFQRVPAGPPFVYDQKEDRIAQEVNHALQRNLLLDISAGQKLLVLLLWALLIVLPGLLQIPFLLPRYFHL